MLAPIHIEASHNTPSATPSALTMEMEDRIMGVLPKPLADWLRYEATSDTCPKVIFQEWRRGMTVDQLLLGLRSITRNGTRTTYGHRHPQAAFARA